MKLRLKDFFFYLVVLAARGASHFDVFSISSLIFGIVSWTHHQIIEISIPSFKLKRYKNAYVIKQKMLLHNRDQEVPKQTDAQNFL